MTNEWILVFLKKTEFNYITKIALNDIQKKSQNISTNPTSLYHRNKSVTH